MCSVADGEMSDKPLLGCTVDKNGFTSNIGDKRTHFPSHASALFFRRSLILEIAGQSARVVIPKELPPGVQLRVSSISLLHSVVRGYTDVFFDAESSTSIGNIRPHMISLLFRSLVSHPREAVVASHNALRDVLALSSVSGSQGEHSKSHSRLPKELLQTCIRPVLLNLRDYTRLSIPLLRGLSKLLSLLSSWFNKTLGEKLLDHLKKWTEPKRITSLGIWNEGEEPLVAAAIVEVFWLLPHASKFVEPLVATCLKIERVLPEFKVCYTSSPFRPHIARFLNRHPQAAVDFFFQRLKYPVYSELFESILERHDSSPLREFLCSKQSSLVLLNVCFERPLAIMRSEKGVNTSGPGQASLHGIGITRLDVNGPPWPMTNDALEVQLHGLRVLKSLVEHNMSYFAEQTDIVRAMRLLWRSRGRFLRLQHEEQVQNRFHDESTLMASFLMVYATSASRMDIDSFVEVMFELLCIFLQAVTANFIMVRRFLGEAPLLLLGSNQKQHFANKIMRRLMAENNEETKVLSIQLLLLPLLTDACRKGILADILEPTMINEFVHQVLFQKGSPAVCSDRLRVECLQLLSVFVDGAPESIASYKKDIVRYCSSLLKSEDIACTSWAYICICQLTKRFGTSEKTTRQVYTALIRSHHQEGKELVRAALDILLPTLQHRLSAQDIKGLVDQTAQIMLEESNSTPQLAHICLTIIKGAPIFQDHCKQFSSLLVGTLNRLGLSTSGPFENKILAAEVIHLLLKWDASSLGTSDPQHLLSNEDQELILNFIVRQLLQLAEPDVRALKTDQGVRNLGESLRFLLEDVLRRFSAPIRPQPFEKVNQAKPDSAVLATSLDILVVVSRSKNVLFMEQNRSLVARVVSASFECARKNAIFRTKINELAPHAVHVLGQSDVMATAVEKILLEAIQSLQRKSSSSHQSSDSPRRSKTSPKDASSQADLSFLVFGLELVKCLCQKSKSFLNRLEGTLLILTSFLTKEHVSEAVAKQRQGAYSSTTNSQFTGILCHTPTKGIISEILKREGEDAVHQMSRSRITKTTGTSSLLRSIYLVLSVLEKGDIFYVFSSNRKTFYHIISSLLDHSDNVMVLMMATKIVGKLLLEPSSGSPVIVKERNSLLWKLSTVDFRCLPNDVVAQPIADLIRHFIQCFRLSDLGQSGDLVFGRSLVACLLNANVEARTELFREYLSSPDASSLSVLDVLWRFLHSDFEGICGRFWIVVLVEAMLSLVQCEDPDLNAALRILIHSNDSMAQFLLESMLPLCWQQQENKARAKLSYAMEILLSRPYHAQFLQPGHRCSTERSTMNSLRAFLNAVLHLRPIPVFDLSLLVSLAENYNAWYEVLSILELQYQAAPMLPLGEKSISAMRHCYRQLSEEKIWMSLARESCKLPKSWKAVSMDTGGFLSDASDAYLELIDLVQAPNAAVAPSEFEMDLWEERWVEIQRQVCQLEVVSEFANASANHRLQLDCAWRTQDWVKVRALCGAPSLLVAGESGDATVKLSETLLAVADGKLGEVENLHAQSAQLCLYKWQLLPHLSSGSPVHASLFHFFHRLVEVRESGQIMVETGNHSEGRTVPDLKNLLNAWRGRLPNPCEPLTMWDEILAWRTHMFGAITKIFHWSEPNVLATLHDRPWTAIRLAKTARKHDLRDVSLRLISRASDKSTMNVLDAYLQLREQILAYMNPSSERERQGGLNLVNTTNLSFFDPSQKSELFRLKAELLVSLGSRSKANQAFCHSVQICPYHSRAWLDWGNLCAELGDAAEQQAQKATAEQQQDKAASSKKVAQYLAQAIGCYLEAVRLDTHEWARLHIAKCLWMLSKDGGTPAVLCTTFESRGALLPSWVWLPWLPQLLSGLHRPEGSGLKQLVSMVARTYPQSIYYPLRAFYLERRDVERARGPVPSGSSQHMPSVQFSEELLTLLRRSHASLCSQLETILEELIVKFRPSTEEDFLGTIIALEERLECQLVGLRKSEEETMAQSCWKTLGRIAVKYFRPSDSTSRNDERTRQNNDFKERYRKQFEADFSVSSNDTKGETTPTPSGTPKEMLNKIREWREKLQFQVYAGPSSLKLVDVSPALAMYGMGHPPDLWPGACDPRYASSRTVTTENEFNPEGGAARSTTSSSAAAAKKAAANAANIAAAAAKREGFGGDFGGSSAIIEIPGNYMPNYSWTDSRPNPELHPKLVRFEHVVEIVRRKENLVRRIGMVGDDGKTYHFVLQCALSYWTRTDERTAQTHFVVDKLLRKGMKSARAHLSVKPQPVIPVAQRLRLVVEPDDWTSMEHEYELYKLTASFQNNNSHTSGVEEDELAVRFNDELCKALSGSEFDALKDADRARLEREKRTEIFRHICRASSPQILTNQILSFLGSTELFYQFKRTFAQQWAADCLFQYVFAIAERNPDQVVFFRNSGTTRSCDARILYNSHGLFDKTLLPFRMTRNLSTLIGFPLLQGPFLHTMMTIADAIASERELMDTILHLLLRDDLIAFYTKSLAKPDVKTQEMEKQLLERISKNVSTAQARLASCAPNRSKETSSTASKSSPSSDDPIDKHVRQLLAVAQKDEQICMMPSTFLGWL